MTLLNKKVRSVFMKNTEKNKLNYSNYKERSMYVMMEQRTSLFSPAKERKPPFLERRLVRNHEEKKNKNEANTPRSSTCSVQ